MYHMNVVERSTVGPSWSLFGEILHVSQIEFKTAVLNNLLAVGYCLAVSVSLKLSLTRRLLLDC